MSVQLESIKIVNQHCNMCWEYMNFELGYTRHEILEGLDYIKKLYKINVYI